MCTTQHRLIVFVWVHARLVKGALCSDHDGVLVLATKVHGGFSVWMEDLASEQHAKCCMLPLMRPTR